MTQHHPLHNDPLRPPGADIKVIGIGGGGGNAINTMIRSKVEGVEFIAANTDVQALQFSLADKKIQLGRELTKGLGAGANPDIGRDAALEDRQAIGEKLEGANMVFVTCGMGGGTGTGGASIVAQIAKEHGALVVGVVTKPFNFEGKKRRVHAEAGINRLREHVDTLITIPNQKLLQLADTDLSMVDAFKMADTVLVNAVKGISDIINVPGLVNVDFADVKTIMSNMGLALMGIGVDSGDDRAKRAANLAVSSPLLEDVDIEGATGILVNITAGENIALREVDEICNIVQEAAHEDCNIIFGAVIDGHLNEQIKVTVIATGFPDEEKQDVAAGGGNGYSSYDNYIKTPPPVADSSLTLDSYSTGASTAVENYAADTARSGAHSAFAHQDRDDSSDADVGSQSGSSSDSQQSSANKDTHAHDELSDSDRAVHAKTSHDKAEDTMDLTSFVAAKNLSLS